MTMILGGVMWVCGAVTMSYFLKRQFRKETIRRRLFA